MTQDQYKIEHISIIKHKDNFVVDWEFVRENLTSRFPLDTPVDKSFDADAVRKKIAKQYPTAPIRHVEDFLFSAKTLGGNIHLVSDSQYSRDVKVFLEILLQFSE